ncbi:MAG: hypothetical protein K2N94_06365 [Lachnospiraceae bacterium]|nr:hypothetical protein [Lachnospiraceae bacterium]
MRLEMAGKQIEILRKKVKMTRKKLRDGLCSDSELAFIEKGESRADMILLAALLERLGKSAERLTYILTAEEYQRLEARDEIEELLRFGRLTEAKRMIEEYREKNPSDENKILFMYEEKILGILALEEYESSVRTRGIACASDGRYAAAEKQTSGEQENEASGEQEDEASEKQEKEVHGGQEPESSEGRSKLEIAAAHFRTAVEQTLSFEELFNGELARKLDTGKKLLAMFEIENILLCLYVQQLEGRRQNQIRLLEALRRYLEQESQDDELRVQYLAKTGMLLGSQYLAKKDYDACVKTHEQILRLNRKCGMIVCVLPLLEQIISAYKKLQNTERAEFYALHKANIETCFGEFQISPDCVNKLYYNCWRREYFIEGTLIAAERKWKGISQEKLIEGIYRNVENLSRIENGRANCDRKKFYMLMERLGIDRTRYSGNLLTDEYQVLELDRELERHLARRQFEEAGHELYMLEKSVDMEEKCNRQLVFGMKNMEACRNGRLSPEEALEKAKELLELTYHLDNTADDGTRYRRIPFRNEMYLFNQVCILLRKAGKIEEAIELRERMIRTYESMTERKKYHFKNAHLCVINLCEELERAKCLEEAEKYADMAIKEMLSLGRTTLMHRLYMTKVNVAGKQGKEYSGKLQQAYLLSEWVVYENDKRLVQEAMEKYNVRIGEERILPH